MSAVHDRRNTPATFLSGVATHISQTQGAVSHFASSVTNGVANMPNPLHPLGRKTLGTLTGLGTLMTVGLAVSAGLSGSNGNRLGTQAKVNQDRQTQRNDLALSHPNVTTEIAATNATFLKSSQTFNQLIHDIVPQLCATNFTAYVPSAGSGSTGSTGMNGASGAAGIASSSGDTGGIAKIQKNRRQTQTGQPGSSLPDNGGSAPVQTTTTLNAEVGQEYCENNVNAIIREAVFSLPDSSTGQAVQNITNFGVNTAPQICNLPATQAAQQASGGFGDGGFAIGDRKKRASSAVNATPASKASDTASAASSAEAAMESQLASLIGSDNQLPACNTTIGNQLQFHALDLALRGRDQNLAYAKFNTAFGANLTQSVLNQDVAVLAKSPPKIIPIADSDFGFEAGTSSTSLGRRQDSSYSLSPYGLSAPQAPPVTQHGPNNDAQTAVTVITSIAAGLLGVGTLMAAHATATKKNNNRPQMLGEESTYRNGTVADAGAAENAHITNGASIPQGSIALEGYRSRQGSTDTLNLGPERSQNI